MAPTFAAARDVLDGACAKGAFPAFSAEVGTAEGVLWRQADGVLARGASAAASANTVFDLASLTKVLATASLMMRQIDRGAMTLDDPVSAHVPLWRDDGAVPATLRDLLSHCSGLPAHIALSRTCTGTDAFERAICAAGSVYPPRTTSVYSDLGFMLLGFVLGRMTPLPTQFDALLEEMGGIADLRYLPPREWRSRTAATRDDPWRGRLLVGEVDDDNAWALGGAAGHAGVFGTASAVGAFARQLLRALAGGPGPFRRETVRTFIRRREEIPGSSRALAWDTMLPTSSCGTRMSPRAFGHVGFTGTSLWLDPDLAVYVVLLTNRVHATPASDEIARVRPAFHDAVYEGLQSLRH